MSCSLIAVLALASRVSTIAQSIETQTGWSGGPEILGPVEHWRDGCLTADGIAWRSIPGKVALSCTTLGQSVQTIIAPDADRPRTCAVGGIDGDGCVDQPNLDILLAAWDCGT